MSIYGWELACAGCGEDTGMHHHRVEIFERAEDAETGKRTTIECGWSAPETVTAADGDEYLDYPAVNSEPSFTDNLDGNPSARRGGIRIHFWCEMCSARTVLTIAQHKGMEFIKSEKLA